MADKKPRLAHCPAGCANGQVTKQVQAERKTADGRTERYTETIRVDCSVCDGSGTVVDWS
jgi:hypothetical protein